MVRDMLRRMERVWGVACQVAIRAGSEQGRAPPGVASSSETKGPLARAGLSQA